MINNNKNQKIKSPPPPIFLRLYRGNQVLIQKVFACTILTSVLLQHQNCSKHTFEESKRALPSHSVELPSHSVPFTYNWKPSSYSSCTKQCGRGTQTRSLSCIKSTDNLPVSHELCSASTKPQTQRACNTQACPTYNWKLSSYSSCTKQCGRGTQTRSLSCIRSTDNATVPNRLCSDSTKPQTQRACNTQACPTYNWKPSSYSSCTKQCGRGTQTRSLSCIRSTDNATVPNRHCSDSTKPQTQRVCNTQACPTYNWKPNSYSSCNKKCGGGTQTRSLSCIRSTDNATVPNRLCSDSTKPQTQRACNTQAATRKTLYKKLTATEDTTNNQLDMLLVIDDSGSMSDDSSRLATKLNGFVNKLKNSGIDWQMCVTTTSAEDYQDDDGKRKGDYGRPIQWQGGNSGHILRKNSGNLNQIFIDTIYYLYYTPRSVGGVPIGGSAIEEGIKAMNLSVQDNSRSNCYRDKAALSVIVISDEKEGSFPDYTLEYLNTPQSFIQTVKNNFSPGKRLTVNSIVVKDSLCQQQQGGETVAGIGHEYIELSNLTGGSVQSICQSDYSIALNDIHNKIDQSLSGLPLACVPTSKPTVTVDYRDYTHNVTVSGNQLFFNPIVQGPATIRGSYFCCGQ